ncbi:MAG: methyltransferase domain-containing protein [Oscillospiraceae bacterium]|nr:methyltransferase domain-containing protein [Oscillospiraceae bacterium]
MNVRTKPLLKEIESYWARRAESYSALVNYEMAHENEKCWIEVITDNLPEGDNLRVLDIGTGPGFFAIGLARRGYDVTAVDYTQAMLDEAMENAGDLRGAIDFCRMDAHALDFAADRFDAIVTRNLTWNLERPMDAYRDWLRVLRPGGVLLNFDAGWYSYLFDEQKADGYREDRERVAKLGVEDFNNYDEGYLMEEISRNLILSRCQRPEADLRMLQNAGFREITADRNIWERVWDEAEKVNGASTPLFLLRAVK